MSVSKRRVRERIKRKSKARMFHKCRIVVSRSNRHMRVQLIDGNKVLGGISTLNEKIRKKVKYSGNKEAAKEVGIAMAEIIKKLKRTENLAFDRCGRVYHGRVAMVAEGLRSSGIKI